MALLNNSMILDKGLRLPAAISYSDSATPKFLSPKAWIRAGIAGSPIFPNFSMAESISLSSLLFNFAISGAISVVATSDLRFSRAKALALKSNGVPQNKRVKVSRSASFCW